MEPTQLDPDAPIWPANAPTRMEDVLERLEELRIHIVASAARPVTPCGSDDNPHMWVTLRKNDGTPYTVCGKCGASW